MEDLLTIRFDFDFKDLDAGRAYLEREFTTHTQEGWLQQVGESRSSGKQHYLDPSMAIQVLYPYVLRLIPILIPIVLGWLRKDRRIRIFCGDKLLELDPAAIPMEQLPILVQTFLENCPQKSIVKPKRRSNR